MAAAGYEIAGEKTLAQQVLRRWEDLKALRIGWEATWEEISAYVMPRRDFGVPKFPGELQHRRLFDATAMIGADRLAAMAFGFLVSPTMPFVRPDVHNSMRARGLSPDLEPGDADWMDGVQWSMFNHFMMAKSGFKTAGFETFSETVAFGTGVMRTGLRPGLGARYQSLPLRNCWLAANEDDEIDTLYYAFTLPAWRLMQRYPETAELDCVKTASRRSDNEGVKLLLAVEPRQGGRAGAMSKAKPFKSCVIVVEAKVCVEEKGYDSFPYSVPRFYVKPGEVYGYGPGHLALPDARLLNAVMESVIRGAELKVDPPLMVPLRLFAKALDRRRGAVNYYSAGQLGLQNADQAVRPINVAGDVGLGVELVRELRLQVDAAFYVDWMRLRESAQMTATEVNDRRDMRLRGMGPIVGRMEADFMGPTADRTFEINAGEWHFGEIPQNLAGHDIQWGYTGPMALAQLQAQRESISLSLALAKQVAEFDKTAAMTIDAEEALRVFGDSVGLAPAVMRSRAVMADLRKKQTDEEAQARSAANDEQAARAFRDGAQGVNTLVSAAGQPMAEAA